MNQQIINIATQINNIIEEHKNQNSTDDTYITIINELKEHINEVINDLKSDITQFNNDNLTISKIESEGFLRGMMYINDQIKILEKLYKNN